MACLPLLVTADLKEGSVSIQQVDGFISCKYLSQSVDVASNPAETLSSSSSPCEGL